VLGERARSVDVELQWGIIRQVPRDPAIRYDACQGAHGIGASAEADEKYPVAVLVKPDEGRVTVDDVVGDA
jgi:hypothetical protein